MVIQAVDTRWSELAHLVLDIRREDNVRLVSEAVSTIRKFYLENDPISFHTRRQLADVRSFALLFLIIIIIMAIPIIIVTIIIIMTVKPTFQTMKNKQVERNVVKSYFTESTYSSFR